MTRKEPYRKFCFGPLRTLSKVYETSKKINTCNANNGRKSIQQIDIARIQVLKEAGKKHINKTRMISVVIEFKPLKRSGDGID